MLVSCLIENSFSFIHLKLFGIWQLSGEVASSPSECRQWILDPRFPIIQLLVPNAPCQLWFVPKDLVFYPFRSIGNKVIFFLEIYYRWKKIQISSPVHCILSSPLPGLIVQEITDALDMGKKFCVDSKCHWIHGLCAVMDSAARLTGGKPSTGPVQGERKHGINKAKWEGGGNWEEIPGLGKSKIIQSWRPFLCHTVSDSVVSTVLIHAGSHRSTLPLCWYPDCKCLWAEPLSFLLKKHFIHWWACIQYVMTHQRVVTYCNCWWEGNSWTLWKGKLSYTLQLLMSRQTCLSTF